MTTTPPDDVAAMFDLPPPEPPQSAEAALRAADAAEAALAAEIAATIDSGGLAADAPDSRSDLRVTVAWPARMQLPDGRVIDLKVRNVSEVGVGLLGDQRIPADAVVNFEMDVPPLEGGAWIAPVQGKIRTTYTVAQGAEILCGGNWVQLPAAGLDLVKLWVRRLQS